jgi:hypothetical protein
MVSRVDFFWQQNCNPSVTWGADGFQEACLLSGTAHDAEASRRGDRPALVLVRVGARVQVGGRPRGGYHWLYPVVARRPLR